MSVHTTELRLTLREFDLLDDALFQRAGDARTEREEDTWLALRHKIAIIARAHQREACQCGHAHRSHPSDKRCRICHCDTFTPTQPTNPAG